MSIQQILDDIKRSPLTEGGISNRLRKDPDHALLNKLLVSMKKKEGRIVSYDVLMPGTIETAVERAADRPLPSTPYKMRRFLPQKTSSGDVLVAATYGVDISADAIMYLVSRSTLNDDKEKMKEQMRLALDTVESADKTEDRSFKISTPKGPILAVGRHYGAAYLDRYAGPDKEERPALERSRPGENQEARHAAARAAAQRFVDEERRMLDKRKNQRGNEER